MSTRTACATLALSLLLAPLGAAATWTVDAGGGGDFLVLQTAIDTVGAGDVLVVLPGTYTGFMLTKDLVIVADTAGTPILTGISIVNTSNARLGGLWFHALRVLGADGVVVIDDCGISSAGLCEPALWIQNSAQVHVSRVEVQGGSTIGCAGPAVEIESSEVTITDAFLIGGNGHDDIAQGGDGAYALGARYTSRVLLARTSCYGGDGGDGFAWPFGDGGDGAEAVHVGFGAWPGPLAIVRGDSTTVLRGGQGGDGASDDGQDAIFSVEGTGTLVVSGVTLQPNALHPQLTKTFPNPPEPFFVMSGNDAAGSTKTLKIYGPAGNVVWLMASFSLGKTTLFGVDGPLYLDPFASIVTIPITTAGPGSPVPVPFPLPPSLIGFEGVTLSTQGAATGLGAGGTYLATNPAHLLLRR